MSDLQLKYAIQRKQVGIRHAFIKTKHASIGLTKEHLKKMVFKDSSMDTSKEFEPLFTLAMHGSCEEGELYYDNEHQVFMFHYPPTTITTAEEEATDASEEQFLQMCSKALAKLTSRMCHVCGQRDSEFYCCRGNYYCSKLCQEIHWTQHRENCIKCRE